MESQILISADLEVNGVALDFFQHKWDEIYPINSK